MAESKFKRKSKLYTESFSDEDDEIDLLELFLYLIQRWIWLLLAFVIGCVGALTIYYGTVDPVYKASAEIYISTSGTVINVQDVQLSSELTADYEEILYSRKVLETVIEKQNLKMNYNTLKSMVSITNPTDSHCLVISVTADSKEKAVNITNSIVKYGIDQIYRTVGKNEPSIIDKAQENAVTEVQTSRIKFTAIGGLACLALICLVFVIRYLMDTTLKTEEDIERYMNLNVLAIVPESASKKKKKEGENNYGTTN